MSFYEASQNKLFFFVKQYLIYTVSSRVLERRHWQAEFKCSSIDCHLLNHLGTELQAVQRCLEGPSQLWCWCLVGTWEFFSCVLRRKLWTDRPLCSCGHLAWIKEIEKLHDGDSFQFYEAAYCFFLLKMVQPRPLFLFFVFSYRIFLEQAGFELKSSEEKTRTLTTRIWSEFLSFLICACFRSPWLTGWWFLCSLPYMFFLLPTPPPLISMQTIFLIRAWQARLLISVGHKPTVQDN